ncbi:MAG: hypothetical protein J0H68_09215 [Sphingobacteriia bacterium]|nr:hypothetical protein [Sphingobacteriia bacterium]
MENIKEKKYEVITISTTREMFSYRVERNYNNYKEMNSYINHNNFISTTEKAKLLGLAYDLAVSLHHLIDYAKSDKIILNDTELDDFGSLNNINYYDIINEVTKFQPNFSFHNILKNCADAVKHKDLTQNKTTRCLDCIEDLSVEEVTVFG